MRRFILTLVTALLLLTTSFAPALAWDPFSGPCSAAGTNTSAVCSGRSNADPLTGANGLLAKITDIVAIIAGIAAVILIIIGGFRYVASNGDSNNINSAKNTILYALVGLAVIIIARTLIVFVVSRL